MPGSNKFQWDDLQHFLAVAHQGSTLAAGRALGVDQSTVQRRLAELERQIGQSLVQRHPMGYRLTEFGQEMLPFAETVESAVLAFERQIGTLAGETSGVIRMTCPEPIVNRITQTGMLDRFHARHPALKVQFVMSDKYMDLRQGDADVALRSGDTDDGELVGRKIGDSLWAVYASKAYIAKHGQPERIEDLASHAMVGFDDSMAKHRLSQWLREVAPGAELASRSTSVLGLIYSVKAGLGVGALPMALGDAEDDLVRVFGPVNELTRIWRMLTTPELRRTPRVSAFFDFVIDEIETLRPILTG
ncbi:LysR family transcriptional regulator [Hydrogenophaga sp. PAMC20947]|uniref:LysR family transcriptional regulator n=1 Tax=Hydrogenophaga sp. PAMC20947 TaxID=2565558 RepID=UPI00109DBD28|nr:LysR family transcriptional regulator [Hydrogenophaga sp. PAMC20947]QCB47146.1 LysR family transcriptional regulator [Hydrogenophaga sp. PAMC20947]